MIRRWTSLAPSQIRFDVELAVEPLGDVLAHVPAPAEDLDNPIGDPVSHLRGVQLDH
jgi:hypothetical protein